MMTTHELHPGQMVLVNWLARRGIIEAIEGAVARVVCFSDERACWAYVDDLEPVIPWAQRGTIGSGHAR